MELRILGPLEVVGDDGTAIAIGGSRERALVARLALSPNRVGSSSQLIVDLWGDAATDGAEHALRVHVSRLRKLLRPAGLDTLVETRSPGYVLRVEPSHVDAEQFEALAAHGREAVGAGEHAEASRVFRESLQLWRGPALADLVEFPFAAADAARLEERRLSVLEETLNVELALGRHREVAAELEWLTTEHPLRERLWELRMLALYRGGRQADALRAYQDLRKLLAASVGLEPMPALRKLEEAILRQDPNLDWSQPQAEPSRVAAPGFPTEGLGLRSPKTRYASSGGVRIAYQEVGQQCGTDLVIIPGFVSNLDLYWENPTYVHMFERLSRSSRIILWDKRGTGLSDPVSTVPSLAQRGEDLLAVLDAVDSARAVLFGISEGGALSLHLAATNRGRVSGVILYGVTPRFVAGPDWDWGWPASRAAHLPEYLEDNWGDNALLDVFAPTAAGEEAAQRAWNRTQRLGASPAMGRAVMEAMIAIDCRDLLSSVTTPTLVLHRRGDRVAYPEAGRYMAAHIANSRLVELDGDLQILLLPKVEPILNEIETFLAAVKR